MSLTHYEFPVTLNNTTDNKRIIGSLWFAPNETLVVSSRVYKASKEHIEYSLEMGYIEVVTENKKKDKAKVDSQQDSAKEEKDDIENKTSNDKDDSQNDDEEEDEYGSIIDKFADKKVHWRAVTKYIDELDDLKEVESLLIDAKFHNIDENGVIVKTINDKIAILTGQA